MIKYGINEIAVTPVRKEAKEQSEMITQLLFGETFQILESNQKWSYIKTSYDDYDGWINANSITELSQDQFNEINNDTQFLTTEVLNKIINNKGEETIIPFCSLMPGFNYKTNEFSIADKKYKLISPIKQDQPDITLLAKQFLNAPYLWGGKNIMGIDCSGFVQILYKVLKKKLPRDANKQVSNGITINFISESEPGDLAFFDDIEGNIVHVGMILNKKEIIHSSVKVRIDKIDQQGIYNEELKKYTHKLRIVKRIF